MTQRPSLRPSPGRGGRRIGVLLAVSALLAAGPARAAPSLRLSPPELTGDQLRLEFALSGFFDEELRESLETGLPATLILRWRVLEPRVLRRDRELAVGLQLFRIYYDLLEGGYELFDARGRSVALTADLDALEARLAEARSLRIRLERAPRPGRDCRVELEARLEPLPADEIRDLERWLRGRGEEGGGLLRGLPGGADALLRRLSGPGARRATAEALLSP